MTHSRSCYPCYWVDSSSSWSLHHVISYESYLKATPSYPSRPGKWPAKPNKCCPGFLVGHIYNCLFIKCHWRADTHVSPPRHDPIPLIRHPHGLRSSSLHPYGHYVRPEDVSISFCAVNPALESQMMGAIWGCLPAFAMSWNVLSRNVPSRKKDSMPSMTVIIAIKLARA
jgi:hypothetical protein